MREPCLTRWGAQAPAWVCEVDGADADAVQLGSLATLVVVFLLVVAALCAAHRRSTRKTTDDDRMPR